MRTQSFLAGLGIAAAVTVAAAAQGTQKPAEVVVIGCLERAAQNSFALKDFRSGVGYRVTTTENIAWHVGHQLEIHGTLAGGGNNLTINASQIVYIATSCSGAPAK